ncbi:MAG: lytic transglycosylase domain-containing protein [Bacteroidia bacterium]
MKKVLVYIIFLTLSVLSIKAQEDDNITKTLDELKSVYYFNAIELGTTTQFNFKPNEIPKYYDDVYRDRINTLSVNSPFNYVYNSVVRKYIDRYTKNSKSVSTILALSKLYFPLYEKYLVQFGIPVELKYLSVVESALNPTAKSPCGAAGLWQFMYGTAKGMKLEINSYVDERFDPEKETIAACQYLKDLHDIYGDWSLAIAAYNCGPGNVNKGIKKAGKKDFWAIYDYLPRETQGYVPAFIAATYIIAYYKEHNIAAVNAKFLAEQLDYITINKKMDLKEIAKLLQMNTKELKYLNPKYYVGVVPGNNDMVVVPKNKAIDWIDIERGRPILQTSNNGLTPAVIASNNTKSLNPPETSNTTGNISVKTQAVVKKASKSIFGTSTIENSTIKIYSRDLEEYGASLKETKILLLETDGAQKLINQGYIKLRNSKEITISNTIIPKNSLFTGQVLFKDGTAYINTTYVEVSGKELLLKLSADISGRNNINYGTILEDGYDIYFTFK